MTRSRRCRASALLVLAALGISACSGGSKSNARPPASFHSDSEQFCGFVPTGPIRTALGTSKFTLTGTVGPDGYGHCEFRVHGLDFNSIEIAMNGPGGGVISGDVNDVRRDIIQHRKDWYIYPGRSGIGYAHKEYVTTVNGQRLTGAFTLLVWGDYKLYVRLYRGSVGRDAIEDAVAIASSIPTARHLPLQPSTPYPTATASG